MPVFIMYYDLLTQAHTPFSLQTGAKLFYNMNRITVTPGNAKRSSKYDLKVGCPESSSTGALRGWTAGGLHTVEGLETSRSALLYVPTAIKQVNEKGRLTDAGGQFVFLPLVLELLALRDPVGCIALSYLSRQLLLSVIFI